MFDISTPSAPVEIGSLQLPANPRDLEVYRDHALYANHYNGLTVIDLGSSDAPRIVSKVNTEYPARNVVTYGEYVLLLSADHKSSGRLQVIDLTVPSSPLILGSLDLNHTATDIVIYRGQVVVDNGHGLRVIDVSNPQKPEAVRTVALPGLAGKMTAHGDYLVVDLVG